MWCRSCQQDVPGVASTDDTAVRCARCHEPLAIAANAAPAPTPAAQKSWPVKSPTVENRPPVDWDDWELDDDLNAADRMLHSLGIRRRDGPHGGPSSGSGSTPDQPPAPPRRRAARKTGGAFLSWSILALGLMTFVFGGVLLGWSFFHDRADLWRLGMPCTLAGQAALVLGLVFQLDNLWRSNRDASQTLDELDEQLDELRRATTLLGTTHSSPARSFYAHLAEGAGPGMLLADLKGQLDLLAQKLAAEERR